MSLQLINRHVLYVTYVAAWNEITFYVTIYLLEKETILNDRTFKRSLPLPLYGFSVMPYNDVHKPTQRRVFMFVQAVVYPTRKGFLLDNIFLLLQKQMASLCLDVILSVFMDSKFSWRTNLYSVFTKKLQLQQSDKIYEQILIYSVQKGYNHTNVSFIPIPSLVPNFPIMDQFFTLGPCCVQ